MPGSSLKCPECDYSFPAPPAGTSEIACPICDTPVQVRSSAPSVTKPLARVARSLPAKPTLQATAPRAEIPEDLPPVVPKVHSERRHAEGGNRAGLWVAAGLLLFLMVGAGMVMFIIGETRKSASERELLEAKNREKSGEKNKEEKHRDSEKGRPIEKANDRKGPGEKTNPAIEKPPPEKKEPSEKRAPMEKKEPEKKEPAPEVSKRQEEINKAIDRGTMFVRKWVTAFHEDRLKVDQYKEGVISLMGYTLLECGVKPDDPSMQRIAAYLREQSEKITQTYCLATAIFFLDRLGNPRDKDLIQTFAMRLVAGQNAWGSWTYSCPLLGKEEEEKLLDFLKTRNYANPDAPGIKDTDFQEALKLLPIRLRDLPVAKKKYVPKVTESPGDNSNTQFALLALWIAKRQGVPTQPSLGLVDRYFRAIQNDDGSWGYGARNHQWCASMTCSGLLGLAVGRSVIEPTEKGQTRDPEIEKAFAFLAKKIDAPRHEKSTGKIIGADAHGDLYFLWSLERVAMVYDLKKIGGKDWYEWASGVLLDSQKTLEKAEKLKKEGKIDEDALDQARKDDGAWKDLYPGPIDTCFALLVLKRVNIAKDLTQDVKKVINLKELERVKQK